MRRLLAVGLVIAVVACAHVSSERPSSSESAQCFSRSAPHPVDSIACVKIAIEVLESETRERFTHVVQFRASTDSVIVLLAGGPSPPWVGGGGRVLVTRRDGAKVLELYQ